MPWKSPVHVNPLPGILAGLAPVLGGVLRGVPPARRRGLGEGEEERLEGRVRSMLPGRRRVHGLAAWGGRPAAVRLDPSRPPRPPSIAWAGGNTQPRFSPDSTKARAWPCPAPKRRVEAGSDMGAHPGAWVRSDIQALSVLPEEDASVRMGTSCTGARPCLVSFRNALSSASSGPGPVSSRLVFVFDHA